MKTKTTVRRSVAFGLLGTLAIGGLATAMGEDEAPKAHFIRPSTKTMRSSLILNESWQPTPQ